MAYEDRKEHPRLDKCVRSTIFESLILSNVCMCIQHAAPHSVGGTRISINNLNLTVPFLQRAFNVVIHPSAYFQFCLWIFFLILYRKINIHNTFNITEIFFPVLKSNLCYRFSRLWPEQTTLLSSMILSFVAVFSNLE